MGDRDGIPDDALVVRCGMPPFGRPTILRMRCGPHHGMFGFSVQSAAGIPLDRLASWCPNRRVGVLTVARIRGLGYDVVKTPGLGRHATVVVPADWDQEAAEALATTFRDVENPSPGTKR